VKRKLLIDKTHPGRYDSAIGKKGRALAADEKERLKFGFVSVPRKGFVYDAVWRL